MEKIVIAIVFLVLFCVLGLLVWKKKMFFLLAGFTEEFRSKIKNEEKFALFNGMMITLYGVWTFVWIMFIMERSSSSGISFTIVLLILITFQGLISNFYLVNRK